MQHAMMTLLRTLQPEDGVITSQRTRLHGWHAALVDAHVESTARLAGQRGPSGRSLRHDLALTQATGEPAGRSLSYPNPSPSPSPNPSPNPSPSPNST